MPNKIPPDANQNVPLGAMVAAMADDPEVAEPTDVHPSNGRVIKDPVDGTIYLGDGANWIDVEAASGIGAPALSTDKQSNPRTSATVSSGAIDASDNSYLAVRGEGQNADTLTTINGGVQGQILSLQATVEDITVDSGADNIKLDGGTNITMDAPADILTLRYDSNNWLMVSFSNNA